MALQRDGKGSKRTRQRSVRRAIFRWMSRCSGQGVEEWISSPGQIVVSGWLGVVVVAGLVGGSPLPERTCQPWLSIESQGGSPKNGIGNRVDVQQIKEEKKK